MTKLIFKMGLALEEITFSVTYVVEITVSYGSVSEEVDMHEIDAFLRNGFWVFSRPILLRVKLVCSKGRALPIPTDILSLLYHSREILQHNFDVGIFFDQP